MDIVIVNGMRKMESFSRTVASVWSMVVLLPDMVVTIMVIIQEEVVGAVHRGLGASEVPAASGRDVGVSLAVAGVMARRYLLVVAGDRLGRLLLSQ